MPTKIYAVELHGLDGHLVEIEADTRMGLPAFIIVGLPDAAIQEARQRVESAVKNSGYIFPRGKIIVNLAPANLRKVGPRYDLPIAMGIIAHIGQIPQKVFENTAILGELALDGGVRGIDGILSSVEFAKSQGYKCIMLPKENAREAALIQGIKILPVGNLREAVQLIMGMASVLPITPADPKTKPPAYVDLGMIKGQEVPKEALMVAAAGGHNLLFSGSPGAGKTMLARALPGILPSMSMEEKLEVTKIYSVAGLLPKSEPLINHRPFRTAHHTASAISIVGGGSSLRPGEITLAHRGVLFLDEIAEFPRSVLEVLRQPMEDQTITITRASGSVTYPAQFTLVAAMNPCPCGFFQIPGKQNCECAHHLIKKYKKRISGPLLDRIDIYCQVQPVKPGHLTQIEKQDDQTPKVLEGIERAVAMQRKRYKDLPIHRNAELKSKDIKEFCPLTSDAKITLQASLQNLPPSARGYHKMLKVARTIADLESKEVIDTAHILRAIGMQKKPET